MPIIKKEIKFPIGASIKSREDTFDAQNLTCCPLPNALSYYIMKMHFLKIAQNIVLPIMIAGGFLLSLVVFAEVGLNTIGGLTSAVINENAERTVLALGALDNINLATIKEKNTLLEKGEEQIALNMREYSELMESAAKKLDQLKKIAPPNDYAVLLLVTDLAAQHRKLTEETVFPLVKQGHLNKATDISFNKDTGGGRALRQKIRAELETIVEENRKEMRDYGQAIAETSKRTKNILILVAASGLALALIWISIIQIIRLRMNKMNSIEALAHGNLDVEIDEVEREDEVAAVVRALELFKENAAQVKRQAEDEENEYARKLKELKKDID